jgi:hypothetical protein
MLVTLESYSVDHLRGIVIANPIQSTLERRSGRHNEGIPSLKSEHQIHDDAEPLHRNPK